MATPIWKDLDINISTASSVQYQVRDANSNVYYTGKSVKAPGATYIVIRLNEIVADLLGQSLPAFNGGRFQDQSGIAFNCHLYTRSSDSASWTKFGEYEFTYDWSYEFGYNVASSGAHDPITGEIDFRCPFIHTTYGASYVDVLYQYADGTEWTDRVEIARSASFDNGFDDSFATTSRGPGKGNIVLHLPDREDLVSIVVEGKTYRVTHNCDKYALIYVNALGGWDSLRIKGSSEASETYTRAESKKYYNNSVASNRGRENYANEIVKGWRLNTGYLKDDQSKRMNNLVGSVNVFLYDLVEGVAMPVVITDKQCVEKTYKGEGRRMVNYTLNVELARDRARR